MRLQKYLASCGVASRRNAEQMILDGRVSVNGEIVNVLGTQVDEQSDTVQVDGCIVRPEAEKHYLAYNKPVGEVTTVSAIILYAFSQSAGWIMTVKGFCC